MADFQRFQLIFLRIVNHDIKLYLMGDTSQDKDGFDMTDNEAEILDLRGLKCPMPVLKANKAMKSMQSEAKVWLETTDPLAVIDIPAFCQENGHSLLETQALDGHHRFLVQKG